jgi:hypothetical protein
MAEPIWHCTRQRAGPLVKECRALRPRLLATDSRRERREKNEIVRSPHSAVCRSPADRLELRLALMGPDSTHYVLTYDSAHLPPTFPDARRGLRAFFARAKRWKGRGFDYIYCIEGKHGDHRYHVHLILRYADFSPAEVRHLWRCGEVDDEPVLRREGGFRRLAEYLNKESTDGLVIPIGRRPWTCSRSLSQGLPPPERWKDSSGVIEIPDGVRWATRGCHQNDFGAYYYASYILPGK